MLLLIISSIVLMKLFEDQVVTAIQVNPRNRTFTIDYDNNRFLKDGQPYRYISGSIHYFRIPSFYWLDRLTKIRAAGLNAIQFYVAWNLHEPWQGNFSFQFELDLIKFIKLAQDVGLDVIVRLGPYTCGEFENGGLPWWLLKIPDIRMRQADPRFLYYVTKWYVKLMPMLLPFLYQNGGPIISMQIENEYGSRSYCDRDYTIFLRDLIRSYVGSDFVLFTVDGAGTGYLKCGFIPEVYPTVDFGCGNREGIERAFAAQRAFASAGPLVNTEFYPGWLDLWGYNHSTQDTEHIVSSMENMYKMGASFNFYMFDGGTNFGYMNGASSDNDPVTTSYDYDAPLNEAGDPTQKYMAIRSQIENLTERRINETVPASTKKAAYGQVPMSYLANVLDLLNVLSPVKDRIRSTYPKTFEQIDFPYGFVLYETTTSFDCSGCNMTVPGINDRGYVMIDGKSLDVLVVRKNIWTTVTFKRSSLLQILVENNGRQCSGFNDPKGLNGNVSVNGQIMENWTMHPLSIEYLFDSIADRAKFRSILTLVQKPDKAKERFVPSIYYGKFQAPVASDTFFNPSNWGKGQFFLNRFNVGRYWPSLGPQVTLYVPKPMVNKLNYIILFELEQPGNCEDLDRLICKVSFDERPILNKTVPGLIKKQNLGYRVPANLDRINALPS